MEELKEFWFKVKDKLFAFVLILLGIVLSIKGFSSNATTHLSQTWQFKTASVVLILLGVLSLYFVLNRKNNKVVGLITNLGLLAGILFFGWMNIHSITDKVAHIEAVKTSKSLAIQGLGDIQLIAKAYDRKYKKNAVSFDELIKFAKFDSITKLTRAVGDIKKGKMTMAEAKICNHKFPPAVTSEEDAIKLKWIIREYEKIPVFNDLFSPEKLKRTVRQYDFDIEKLTSYRTIDSETGIINDSEKKFVFNSIMVDSVTFIKVSAFPPYGPQAVTEILDTIHFGSLNEKSVKTSW